MVVGVSGASGIVLAYKLLRVLAEKGYHIDCVMSKHALYAASLEMGKEYASSAKFIEPLNTVTVHSNQDVGCSICSGSFPSLGMVIIPCSMGTVAAIACGLADNALRRAADVTLKERRPLVIVPRECPLSSLHLENLLRLSNLGATIVPPIPAWYTQPKSVDDIENFIVGRVLDALKIDHALYPRWGEDQLSSIFAAH